ncbi:MAG TPA: AAA family ATPase, partial [Polyangiaceae bacterium]|nr:AAA family ATPase [Polyangiaceae bacterium]
KLLDKDLAARFGYADEVAALLADLSDDVHRLPDFPPPRSYLYRPRLVGRKALIAELNTLRERAAEGSGTLVLLAGESGVGKTRVAMEVTRLMSGSWMQTVTSESSLLPSDGGGGASPLQAVRPLLQAIADHCQEAGAETTERLLGDRRSVLAQYEPLLAQVPAAPGSMAPPMPLAVDASRRRLFKYLSETLAAFAQEQPVLWVIDDLGWADDLSLAFLQSLTREYLEATRVLILCTYRSEEATDAVTAIASLPHVTHITVPRLGRDAVSTMVGDMLAMPEKRDDFVEFVSHQAEGNPFFVTEYLRAAVTERVLYRDGQHSWQMPGHGRDGVQQLESLPLPGSLREVIEQRLRRLSPAGQQAGLAAAVLGREADVDVVREVASLSDEAAVGAVDELLRRQVLQQTEEGRVRFVHDKLREVAYAHAPAERVVALHARAASALESRWKDRPEANQHWATLGHHFAAAKRAKPAATYLKLAADHARATYANGDAIRLYREAIKQVNETLLSLSTESARPRELLIELNEALGDVLALTGKGDDARAAYEMALGLTAEDAAVGRARLYRKVGKTCETQHKHAEALAQYTLARRFVSTNPIEASAEERDEWFQVRVDELWVYYWLDKADTMAPIVTDLSSFVDNFATSLQRMKFFRAYFLLNLRKDRFVITPETLRLTHAAFTACNGSVADAERAFAQFHHGFALLFSNAIEEAIAQLQSANDIAVRLGDISLQARCFAYLALANRMGGHPTNTLEFTESCERIVHSSGMLEYVGTSHAHRAWLCMRKGDLIAGRREAEEALLVWRNRIFPFHWLALLPLLAASLSTDNVSEAVRFAEALLDPTQQRLPGQSPLLLQRAIETWASNDGAAARSLLQTALKGLDDAGYR